VTEVGGARRKPGPSVLDQVASKITCTESMIRPPCAPCVPGRAVATRSCLYGSRPTRIRIHGPPTRAVDLWVPAMYPRRTTREQHGRSLVSDKMEKPDGPLGCFIMFWITCAVVGLVSYVVAVYLIFGALDSLHRY